MDKQWMIYGANGYSGKLVAQLAVNKGYKPILAGRNESAIIKMANDFGLDSRVFGLENENSLAEELKDINLVLNCAGPFVETAEPFVKACLKHGVHYLDLSGELEVFEYCYSHGDEAKEKGILICPGVAFDVVPTEAIAAKLKAAMPDATTLKLGFDGDMSLSPGSSITLLKGIGNPNLSLFMVRENNILEKAQKPKFENLAYEYGGKRHKSMTLTWADLNAAHYSTDIPNIYVFIKATLTNRLSFAYMQLVSGVFKSKLIQAISQRFIKVLIKGPTLKDLENNRMLVFGEISNIEGQTKRLYLNVSHGYKFTSQSALAFVDYCLNNNVSPGYCTPSQLTGPDFVLGFTGSRYES